MVDITIIGSGYVGLVAGACFAETGHHVTCLDIDSTRVQSLKKGQIPFYEPMLSEVVTRNTQAKRLFFTDSAEEALKSPEIVFLAVGTPTVDGKADLSQLENAIQSLLNYSKNKIYVVVKSTVPIGTCEKLQKQLAGKNIEIISNPEFLKQGSAVEDFLKPERVVVGCQSPEAVALMKKLYEPFLRSGKPFLVMDLKSAELSKYAANIFLAMKISFINEIAFLSERLGSDVDEIRKVLTTDSRIGSQFLYPGCGFGGSCFPKDLDAMIQVGEALDYSMPLFTAVRDINKRQKRTLFQKLKTIFKGDLKNKKIALWGLSFKPQTDDIREAPSLELLSSLIEAEAQVMVFDPMAMASVEKIFGNKIHYAKDQETSIDQAEALILVTEWNEFRQPDFKKIKEQMARPLILDGRNLFSKKEMKQLGFEYHSIGRSHE